MAPPATPSSASSVCAAGISLDFSAMSICASISAVSVAKALSTPPSRGQALGGGAVTEIVETAAQRLAVERNAALSGSGARGLLRRDEDGSWPENPLALVLGDTVALESIGFSALVAAFYLTA